MGNRGFGSGGRGVIQTSICPIDVCILKCSRQGGIRTAAYRCRARMKVECKGATKPCMICKSIRPQQIGLNRSGL